MRFQALFLICSLYSAASLAHVQGCKKSFVPRQFSLTQELGADPADIDLLRLKVDDFALGTVALRQRGTSKSFSLKDDERNPLATAIVTTSKGQTLIEVFDCPGNKLGSIIDLEKQPSKNSGRTLKVMDINGNVLGEGKFKSNKFKLTSRKHETLMSLNGVSKNKDAKVSLRGQARIDRRVYIMLAAYEMSSPNQ